ncbi:alpha/beta hydrolase family protein [Chitinophaga eiseniae]|uniref:S9 family peptidase n=1 Tax=Chitinophaga eiseniae TaxID=634771 RepID=A0A847SUP3_9BACT|nr:prolyl oligopeptidase family serine peptidase [Chitinophaga eiseniae]NLR81429.1 S9 family peptidase [Chitinophaga eiseniae]
MKSLFCFVLLCCLCMSSYCQEPDSAKNVSNVLASNAYREWTSVANGAITNNGLYVSYFIDNQPIGHRTLVLKRYDGSWEYQVPFVQSVQFTPDSKAAIFVQNGDSLCIVKLGNSQIELVDRTESFEGPMDGGGKWGVYRRRIGNELIVWNFISNEKEVYRSVDKFVMSESGRQLIMNRVDTLNGNVEQSLILVDFLSKKVTVLWTGNQHVDRILVDRNGTQIVFLVSEMKETRKSIFCCRVNLGAPFVLVNDSSLIAERGVKLDYLSAMSEDGRYVFFYVKEKDIEMERTKIQSNVVVWSYLDVKLQPQQMEESTSVPAYDAVCNINNREVTILIDRNENVIAKNKGNNVFLILHSPQSANLAEAYWNIAAQKTYWIKSLMKGEKYELNINGNDMVWLSPEGKYVIYYDRANENYYSYDIASHIYRNITGNIAASWINYDDDENCANARGIATWTKNDKTVLIYDRFDIWEVDPTGSRRAINLTKGFGYKEKVVLSLGLSQYLDSAITIPDYLILNGFNTTTKENGFLKEERNSRSLEILSMGNYIYQIIGNRWMFSNGVYPIKAKCRDRYLLTRMSATESPNYFYTVDFRTFNGVSKVYPERNYNWYTTELHKWKKSNGTYTEGILYKPRDFDSTKKYPVILYYYERNSFALNLYLMPDDLWHNLQMNIPTVVSNGYLVLALDIDYVKGTPMQGTLETAVSAVRYLSTLSFVNSGKIGLSGASFGGSQTNYLVTHTNLFAAASSASGFCDLISAYNSVTQGGMSFQNYFESDLHQGRMGGSLWEVPGAYIKNSAIFNADKVNTPVLLMHGTHDGIVPFSQSIEFFTALRRLGKKVWLLEYTDGGHGIFGASAEDYRIRMLQFFDHYLKDLRAPKWMTRSSLNERNDDKGGYELDYKSSTPGRGLLRDSFPASYRR